MASGKTKTRRGRNKSQKETAEKQRRESNGKKAKTWYDRMYDNDSRRSRSEASSGSDSDGKGSSKSKIVKRFIRSMANAVQADMRTTLPWHQEGN